MVDTQSAEPTALAPVPGPAAASASGAGNGADTHKNLRAAATTNRRRRSQSAKPKSPTKTRAIKKQLLKERERELIRKYLALRNLYYTFLNAKEEFFEKYKEAGCPFEC